MKCPGYVSAPDEVRLEGLPGDEWRLVGYEARDLGGTLPFRSTRYGVRFKVLRGWYVQAPRFQYVRAVRNSTIITAQRNEPHPRN
jgi:hypothetical protein